MSGKTHEVNLGTRFPVWQVTKPIYYGVEAMKFCSAGAIGICITWMLYSKCLFNPHCNSVAVGYFSLLALTCFGTCGVPLTKIDKSEFLSIG